MKKLAFGVSLFLLAFLSASMAFGQTDEYEFVFTNVAVGSGNPTQALTAFSVVPGMVPWVNASVAVTTWNVNSNAWVSVSVPESEWGGQSQTNATLGPGNQPLKFTVPDLTAAYKVSVRWYQVDGPHAVTKYWFPNGISEVGNDAEFEAIVNLSLGPAEILPAQVIGVSTPLTALLGGIASRTDADYVVYQSNGNGQLVRAQKGAYVCTQAVTVTFSKEGLVEGPVFVGVKSGGLQLDQVFIAPFTRLFEPQCQ